MNDTPNPTAESVIAEAMVNAGAPLMHSRVEESVAAALRAHGLLSEGTPSETKWVCGKCSREQARGHDDGQIPEHHRTCPKRTEAKQPEDWSTEELDKVTLDRLQELAEERGYDKGFAAGWKSGGRTADLLAPKLRKAQAERDAALAAIERVRAEADAYAEQSDVMEPCGAVAQALRTALDGAPEPEGRWEYRGRLQSCGYVAEGYISAEHAMNGLRVELEDHPYLVMDDTAIVERARVREWLPVGGEQP